MSNSVVTPEESNFLRAKYLCHTIAPRAVRAYFDNVHPPTLLTTHLQKDYAKLNIIRGGVIKKLQWEKLYPSSGLHGTKSSDYDITLLICLLRNMTPRVKPPPFGFDNLPDKSHTSNGAHLARIKFYRNKLAHSSDGKLSASNFEHLWNDINEAILGLGGATFKNEINGARTIVLDSSLIERFIQLDDLEKKYEALLTDYSHDKCKLENDIMVKMKYVSEVSLKRIFKVTEDRLRKIEEEMSEPIPKNRREQIKIRLDEWRKENQTFISTKAAEKLCKQIKENNCVTVTGCSGVGKTAAVRNAALALEQEGYKVVPVSTPEDILNFYNHKGTTLFVIDDLCGKYTLKQQYLDDWKLRLDDIDPLLHNGKCKVMATCRLQVFKDKRFKDLSIFTKCECNLNSEELNISLEEKSRFVHAFCGEHSIDIYDLLNTCEFVPLLCSLFQKSKHADIRQFFSNPFQCYDNEMEHLLLEDDSGRYKYCCLVLVVIFNNRLKEEILSKKPDSKVKKIIKDALSKSKLNKGTSKCWLLESLNILEGTFLAHEEGYYTTVHDKLFDYLSQYFGKNMIDLLIDHADSEFISKRFIWMTTDQTTDIEFIISIPDEYVDDYIVRMIKDWKSGKVLDVFDNRNMESQEFTTRLLSSLSKLDPPCQSQLAQMKVDNKYEDTTLIQSCFLGDINLTKWIIDNGVCVNQCRNDGSSPLYIACQDGHLDIIRELITRGADVNKCDDDDTSPLYIACQDGQLDIIRELITCKADVDKCDNEGTSPLYIACEDGQLDIVRELITFKADVNKCDNEGTSPLYIACENGHLDIVRELIVSGADLNKYDNKGNSPLHAACYGQHVDIVRELIKCGTDNYTNMCSHIGESPLFIAVFFNSKEIVKVLLDNKSDVNKSAKNKEKYCEAIDKYHKQTIDSYMELYREHGIFKHALPEVNHYIRTSRGNKVLDLVVGSSPLHMACFMGHVDIVKFILEKNPYINIKKEDGTTPLFLACEFGHLDIVNLMIENGADDKLCRNDGKSPSCIASENGHIDVALFLSQRRT